MTINGLDALCPQFNCNYTYVTANGSVTGQALDGTTLTLTGTELPTGDDLVMIKFASVNCTVSASSDTSITCTLAADPLAGDW